MQDQFMFNSSTRQNVISEKTIPTVVPCMLFTSQKDMFNISEKTSMYALHNSYCFVTRNPMHIKKYKYRLEE